MPEPKLWQTTSLQSQKIFIGTIFGEEVPGK
jgi:hypothetical protein